MDKYPKCNNANEKRVGFFQIFQSLPSLTAKTRPTCTIRNTLYPRIPSAKRARTNAPRTRNMPNVQQLAGRGREGPGTEGCRIFKLRGDPSRKLDEGEGLGITDGGGISRRSLAGKVLQNQ